MGRVLVRIMYTGREVELDHIMAMHLIELGVAEFIDEIETATAEPPENAMKKRPKKRVRYKNENNA